MEQLKVEDFILQLSLKDENDVLVSVPVVTLI